MICTWLSGWYRIPDYDKKSTVMRWIAPASLSLILVRSLSPWFAEKNLETELACVSFSHSDTQSSRSLQCYSVFWIEEE
jgi:hypothetical protein